MDIKRFEETVKKINKSKYHISRTLMFDNNNVPYIGEWAIFRKYMSTEEYFDPKNLAVLSSKNNNTIEDIEKLIEEENNESIQ